MLILLFLLFEFNKIFTLFLRKKTILIIIFRISEFPEITVRFLIETCKNKCFFLKQRDKLGIWYHWDIYKSGF